MSVFREERAQGSIEMLVLIGGAVVIAAVVGWLLKQAASQGARRAGEEAGPAAGG